MLQSKTYFNIYNMCYIAVLHYLTKCPLTSIKPYFSKTKNWVLYCSMCSINSFKILRKNEAVQAAQLHPYFLQLK